MKFAPFVLLFSTVALGQAAPQITDAQRAEFFKAQSKLMAASEQAKGAQTEFQAAVTRLQAACGEKFFLQMSPAGDPACVAKPSEKPEVKK